MHFSFMKRVALTGSIGSGKSLIAGILREKGYKVLDADSIVSVLYKKKYVQEEILKLFNSLDRKEIARQAFSSLEKRKRLESILHPLARKMVLKKLMELRRESIVFVEAPLLFEAGFERDFDFVVVVTADKETRINRLIKKGLSREECEQIMNTQMPEEERIKKADFVIDNNGTIEETKEQLEILLKKLRGLNE